MARHKIRIGESEGCRAADLSPDATIKLPYRPLLGYDKLTVRRGDFIMFADGSDRRAFGRMLGAVTPCERLPDDTCERYIAAIVLSDDGHYACVRWVAPGHVIRCYAPRGTPADFAVWFYGDTLDDPARVMRQSKAGALSIDYIGNRDRY